MKEMTARLAERIHALKAKFPNIIGPHTQDICYATENRQVAVKNVAHQADLVLVVGVRDHSGEKRVGDGPCNARHAHGGRADDRTHEAHHCPVHAQIVASKGVRQKMSDAVSAIR